MIYRQFFTCLLLLTLIAHNGTAFPPSSPAGGNYLALDGVDDYAVLDFKTFDVLLPEGTDEFTVEAWVYPTTPPDKHTTAMILSQQVLMRVVSYEYEGYEKLKKAIDWRRGRPASDSQWLRSVRRKNRPGALFPNHDFAESMVSHRLSGEKKADNDYCQ